MTETTRPPSRPTSPRGRGTARGTKSTTSEAGGPPGRAGDRPKSRSAEGRPRRDPSSPTRGIEPTPSNDDARIAKVMARAGLCSRRDAESWIAAGRVAVNGRLIDSPALNVTTEDQITVDGVSLPAREPTRLFLFHKPRGLVTTARDPEGRPTIFDNLPEGLPRVVSVGRLDINTEGLMLLTNDGGLARLLELPSTGWLRRYRVRANGAIDHARLEALKDGVTVDGIEYAGIIATLDRVQGANAWLTLGLREGKNREVKRVLESLGLAVTRLIRVSYGPFQLGELAEGAVEAVPNRVLRDQLGPTLLAGAGVDLEIREALPTPQRGSRTRTEPVEIARPSRSNPPPPRAHVSALRSARAEGAGEGRKRIERGATADRKGRTVGIERVIPVGASGRRGDEQGREPNRNARRFAAEQRDGTTDRQKTRADGGGGGRALRASSGEGRPTRRADSRTEPGRDRSDGPAATPRREGRPTRSPDSRTEPRRDRSDGPGATPRREGRPTRSPDSRTEPRRDRSDGPAATPRREGRPARSPDSRTEPRRDRSDGPGATPRREGPDQPGGTTGRAELPRGGPVRAGKPQRRAGGFSSERPLTGRNKKDGTSRSPVSPGPSRTDRTPGNGRPRGGKPPTARS